MSEVLKFTEWWPIPNADHPAWFVALRDAFRECWDASGRFHAAAEREKWQPCVNAIHLRIELGGICLVCGALKGGGPFKHRDGCGYAVAIMEEEVL